MKTKEIDWSYVKSREQKCIVVDSRLVVAWGYDGKGNRKLFEVMEKIVFHNCSDGFTNWRRNSSKLSISTVNLIFSLIFILNICHVLGPLFAFTLLSLRERSFI